MIVIAGFYRFPPENLAAIQPAMARMIEASRAEPGCVHYAFSHDVLEGGMIRVSECWNDQAAFDSHAASPHMAQWRADSAEHGIQERTITVYAVKSARTL